MSLPKYPSYREFASQWLREIPEHWVSEPCRHFVVEQTAKNENAANQAYLSLMANVGIIPYEDKGDVGNKKPEDLSKCKLVEQGDLVINSMNYGIGSYGLSDLTGVCSPVYIVLRPRLDRVRARFAFRVFENKAFQTYAQSFGNGILEHRAAINWDILKCIRVGIPPIEEQDAILAFLDRETAKIDALIAEQEKLIALLAEKRQATISHAVTKGLNPDAPMKDSGVPWLGEVPAHWEVLPLKRFLSFLTSGSRGWAEHYSDDGAIFLRIGNLTRDGVELDLSDIQRVSPPEGAEGSRTRVEPGDVLFSITAFLGSVASVPEGFAEAYVSQHVALARLIPDGLQPRWVAYTTLSDLGVTYLASQGYGGTKIQLSLDDIRNLPVTVPPPHEQQATLQFLDTELTKLRDLRCEAEHAVALLKERRSALIAAAVTGQVDVRGCVSAEAA